VKNVISKPTSNSKIILMGNLFSSSIGKKLIMSITGLFMITFLVLHLAINLLLLVSSDAYNIAVHFMGTNPMIKVMEPVLGAGFLFHIIYAFVLTIRNSQARPVKYNSQDQGKSSTWASRNMVPLGGAVLLFLVLHVFNFYIKMKFIGGLDQVTIDGVVMDDAYTFVSSVFLNYPLYDILYIIAFILLGIHLSHGFWSAFQSIGWSNEIWKQRLMFVGKLYAVVITVGFSIIPLYFLFKSLV
jgi:succinate dehydrogenase / fumarate reductase, cytochrome b subunit